MRFIFTKTNKDSLETEIWRLEYKFQSPVSKFQTPPHGTVGTKLKPMLLTITQFLTTWNQETEATIACFQHLTDESLSADLLNGYRTIERTVNHITDCAISIPQAATVAVEHTRQHYTTVDALLKAYKSNTAKVKAAVSKWTDSQLQEEIPMYGETWKKGFALWVTIAHQIHHRGQLTVLMRMAGLKVPGVYGPAKEEWEAANFPPAD